MARARATLDRGERGTITRKKLVNGALELFSTDGYDDATIDDIAQVGGYSKGAYYFHFSTKEDVLMELLRLWTEDRTTALAAHGDDGRTTAASAQELVEAFLSYAQEPRWPGVLLVFWTQAMRSPDVSKRLVQAYAGWRKTIASAFERASATGGLRIESADEAANVVLAAHDGYAVQVAIGAPQIKTMSAADLAASLVTPLRAAASTAQRRSATG